MNRYTQREEQSHILAAVGDAPGRLLDIGSWHATALSNSRALIELGWSAVLIEPSPIPVDGLIREYANNERVSIIFGAVGLERSLVKFHFSQDALSTSSEASFERWRPVGGFYGSAYVPVITLADVLNKFGAFDFVSIDTEGSSVDLFHELLVTAMHPPRCIVVEHDGRIAECVQAASGVGYRETYRSEENLVFSL